MSVEQVATLVSPHRAVERGIHEQGRTAGIVLEDVLAHLRQEGWKGFSLCRRFLEQQPRERRRLARALRAVPWEMRPDAQTRRVRFAFLGSFSTDNITDALWLAAMERGVIPAVYHAPFNQFSLLVRDAASPLYAQPFDIAVVAVAPADRGVLPGAQSEAAVSAAGQRFVEDLLEEVRLLHERSHAIVLLHMCVPPEFRPFGLLEWRRRPGLQELYMRLNLALIERCRAMPWIHLVDIAALSATTGVAWPTLHQPRFMGAYALPEALTMPLSREYVAVAAALKGFTKKCLVMDLDNTLWGGVVGEDGVAHLQIGNGYPGNIYQELQQVIVHLYERGVILAINSKNNERDAWEPFAQRPEMALRREHFSAWRINWQDKAANLQEIAQELNIGLDSCVVLDDHPVERAWLAERFPDVHVLPAQDPLEMVRLLTATPLFDALDNTAEDRLRAKSYAAAAQRRVLQASTTDMGEFLAQLQIAVTVHRPGESQLGRVAQLTQRTNQFNLTTRRYTSEQIQELWRSDDHEILCCEVRDKFADEGLVGLVLLHTTPRVWSIDTFLLSCRVLGRGVERALLWAVIRRATRAGARALQGEYIRSAKNQQTEGFFRDVGFTLVNATAAGSTWSLALPSATALAPPWITLTLTEQADEEGRAGFDFAPAGDAPHERE